VCGDGGGEVALVNERVVVAAEQREVQQAGRAAVGPVCDVVCFSGSTCVKFKEPAQPWTRKPHRVSRRPPPVPTTRLPG